MHIQFVAKDNGSGDGGCPAAYTTETAPADYRGPHNHGVLIQGIRTDDDTAHQTRDLAATETLAWVPDNVILAAAKAIEGRQ